MRSTIDEHVFREPDGRPETLIYFGSAAFFLSIHVYYAWILGSNGSTRFTLVMAVIWALFGITESLPESRRQTTGVLRLTVLVVLLCLIVAFVFAPGFLFG
ncbi:hypothetical protein [Halorhabdus sp. BNX81]|uniref:hypothetical protein n=1 Tax=Halorhabdus sp. BNX81 TaxID=2980181 RepID=UPI0023DD3EC5|nr:hypothetical protein [Halorhabdus sp. BNX81]WEL20403.1 hypothetical protein HBNXHr_0327 [Halorhabdus sp. BNX81]